MQRDAMPVCPYASCRNLDVEHVETYTSGVTEFFCRVCKRYFSRKVLA